MTPSMINSSGRSAPRLIRTGRRKLSISTAGTPMTTSMMPGTVWPVANSQMMAGRTTRIGPICARHRTRTMAVRKSRLRHARRRQGNAGGEGLCKRRQDNAECDAAYRSPRQVDNLLAALVGQPPSKEPAPVGRHFTLGIKNGGNADRQEKVQHRPSEASGSREKPFRDGLGIGTNQLNDVVRAAFHQAFPFFGNGPTHQWNIGQPRRRWRQTSTQMPPQANQ